MDWLSGGVLFGVGAVLWVAYLLPSMLRKREQQNAQIEAARLQRALETLAQTGELPPEELPLSERLAERKRQHKLEIEIERENLKLLHEAEQSRKAEAKSQHAAELRAHRDLVQAQKLAHKRQLAERRRASLRGWRTFASWLLLISVLTVIGGGVAMAFGVTWMVAGGGVIGLLGSVVTLRAVVRGMRAGAVEDQAQSVPARASAPFEPVEFAREAESAPQPVSARQWTPQEIPTPLHLAAGSQAAVTVASSEALEALRRRAREIAAESTQPALPSVSAARARAAAMAAHPATYGALKRRAEALGHAQAGRSAQPAGEVGAPSQLTRQAAAQRAQLLQAAAPARALTAAEQVARRYASAEALALAAEPTLDVSEVLQRRRAV